MLYTMNCEYSHNQINMILLKFILYYLSLISLKSSEALHIISTPCQEILQGSHISFHLTDDKTELKREDYLSKIVNPTMAQDSKSELIPKPLLWLLVQYFWCPI